MASDGIWKTVGIPRRYFPLSHCKPPLSLSPWDHTPFFKNDFLFAINGFWMVITCMNLTVESIKGLFSLE